MPSSRMFLNLLPWYSVLVTAGIVLALVLCRLEEKRLALPRDTTLDLGLYVVPLGILGARIYYVIFTWELYAARPLSVFFLWEGGLAIYGGVLGGLFGAWLLSRRRKIPLAVLLDIVCPGLALGQCIGRWGNFFNMEAYGEAVTSPALQFFPFAVLIGEEWHMATFFYESAGNLAIFLVLWLGRRRRTRRGDTFLTYVLLYGALRCVVEGLRLDSLMSFLGLLRVSQALSVLMVLAVCAVAAYRAEPRWRLLVLPSLAGLGIMLALAGSPTGVRTLGCAVFGLLSILACVLLKRKEAVRPCPPENSAT